jgi:hypothetical protein
VGLALLPGTWMENALCAFDPEPDDWHPNRYPDDPIPPKRGLVAPAERDLKKAERAIGICNMCRVREECEDWILTKSGETEASADGIWAAMTPEQRRAIYRMNRRKR